MNIASNVTLVRVSRVWLSAVAMALILVVSNIAPATAQSTATVMVSNLGEAPEVRQRVTIIVGMGQAYAHSFHTGSTAVTLEKVRLYLRGLGSAPAFTIRADSSGEPGRSLHALTNPTIDSLMSTHEDLTATGYVLAADTTYWLVLHRQWGSDNIRFSASICDRLSTPEGETTGEVGWSLGEKLFFGLGSKWQVSPLGCRRMMMAVYASAQTTSLNQAANSPATGWPGITGTVRAGETLTATTDRIEDEDGLTDAVFAYRWVRQDPATRTDADIEGATSSTYTVTDADEGKAIKVRVTFDDDAGNAESLTSDARLSAPPLIIPDAEVIVSNTTATGEPTITGTIRVGETLTANTTDLSDSDGLNNATFTYQWLADDADITDATGSTYALVAADEGKTIKVRVTFTDDSGHQETLTSTATVAVASAPTTLTAAIHDAPESHDGEKRFTFELRFSEDPKEDFSYKTLRDHAFTVTRGTVAGARRLDGDSDTRNIKWEISVTPDSNADVTVELPATTDCDAQGAICTEDGTMLSSPLKFTVKGPPLTASFESVPTSHNGSDSFRIRIAFSEAAQIGLQLHHDARPRLHGDRRLGNRRAAAGQRQEPPMGDRRQPGLQRGRDDHSARHHGLRRAGGHLRRRRQEVVQPPGAHRQRAGPVEGKREEAGKYERARQALRPGPGSPAA